MARGVKHDKKGINTLKPSTPPFTLRQVKAARALLDWSQLDLALKTGLAKTTIASYEAGTCRLIEPSWKSIEAAFTAAGVSFIKGGVIWTDELGTHGITLSQGRTDNEPITS